MFPSIRHISWHAQMANVGSSTDIVQAIGGDSCRYTTIIDKLYEFISSSKDDRVVLVRNKEVLMWLFGDTSFLSPIEKRNKTTDTAKYKELEDEWGRNTLKIRRPDLKLDKQWTNMFGEHICEEILMLMGKTVTKPPNKNHYQPDRETENDIWEAKAQTFYTTGTAGEKILGCIFKYAEVPALYSKPLKILCMGGAEKVCREHYGNLPGPKASSQKNIILQAAKDLGIEYVGATDVLSSLIRD